MRIVLWGALIAVPLAGTAAQESGLPPITVRPSGIIDEGAETRARQERLSRRLEQSDYAFRAICTHCAREPVAPGGLFYPFQALRAPPPSDRVEAPDGGMAEREAQ